MGLREVAVKDVLFYDAVGMPYTGTTLRTGGLGGTEQFIVLLAEELVKEGLSVTVATKTAARTEVNGVEYVPLQDAPPTETLVHLRYGDLHCADFYKRRILFCTDSADISLGSYDKYGHEFRKNTDLVVVCRWQLELFKQRGLTGWRSEHVITGILPESVLAKKTGKPPKYPHRFVYASAARKGLRETLEAWHSFVPTMPASVAFDYGDAELVITNPGYDVEEAARIYRSAPRPNTSLVGVLPSMDAVAELIAESAGLFYVNTYAECSSITLAMTEALGRRVHMLCKAGYGGTRDTVRSRLVTDNADVFQRDFFEALANPELARWYGEPYDDFRASFVTKAWMALVKPLPSRKKSDVVTYSRNALDVAVIIPCFNQAQFLPEAVASVKAQTCPPKEIVVVCGDVESIRVASTLDVQRWTRDPGYGLAHARNLGISFTNCPLIFPLDADDIIEPTCLEKMTREVNGNLVIVASRMQEFGESGGRLDVTEDMLAKGYASPMCLFSRKLWELTGGYDVASPIEDWAFWLDCHKHSPALRLLKERLVRRRMHPKQATKVDPYELFMSVDRWLRPDRFERTERDERNVASPVIQRWVSRRLGNFPDNERLRSLVRPTSSFQTPIRTPPGKLGLCMIVRNESKVIERCLKSVRPLLSYWTVVDTGSTDGTQALVRKALEGIPGELYERPWVDFSTNRNQALAFAEGHTSHVLVIDADDVLEIPEGYRLPEFTADGYHVRVEHGEYMHSRVHVFRPEKFCYRYVLHEGLFPTTNPIDYADLSGVTMRIMGGGHRNAKRNKFISDALVIKRALQKEPGDTRYAFYLAQSWRDAFGVGGNYDHLSKALRAYVRRADMGGDPEEIYLSLVEIARCREKLGHLREFVEEAYRDAFGYRSFRAEPLYYLARWLRMKYQDHTQAVIFARHAASLHKPTSERLFIEPSVYDWRALDEFVVCTTWLPFLREEGRSRIDELLRRAPSSEHERIRGMR